MNKERLLQLADVVEKGHHKFNGLHTAFNMEVWLRNSSVCYIPETREDITEYDAFECNSTACIAGFACLLFDYEETLNRYMAGTSNIEDAAMRILELNYSQATLLFEGVVSSHVTGPEAASVIRHFV